MCTVLKNISWKRMKQNNFLENNMLENLQKEEIATERHHVCCGKCARENGTKLSQLRSILLDNPGEYLHYDNIFIEFSNPIVAYDDCDRKRYFFTAKGELFNSKNDSLKAKVLFSNLLENPILFEKSSQKRTMILRNPYRDDSPKWTEEIERCYGSKTYFWSHWPMTIYPKIKILVWFLAYTLRFLMY